MIRKKTTKLLLTIALLGLSAQQATAATSQANFADMYKKHPWRFAEEFFVVQPKKQINTFWKKTFRYGSTAVATAPSLGLGALTGTFLLGGIGAAVMDHNDRDKLCIALGAGATSVITGAGAIANLTLPVIVYVVLKKQIEKHVHASLLKHFMLNWKKTYKQYTPESMHSCFDTLYKEYKATGMSNKYLNNVAPKVFLQAQLAVYRQFPEKYEHRLNEVDDKPKTLLQQIKPPHLKLILAALGVAGTGVVAALAFKIFTSSFGGDGERPVDGRRKNIFERWYNICKNNPKFRTACANLIRFFKRNQKEYVTP